MTKLPRLYKTTKTSAIQICDISYASDRFFVSWGQLDGAMQDKFTICKPTNEGRANHRDATAQAEFEALAKHKSKIKSGYQLTADAAPSVQLPMKVKVWEPKRFKPGFISTPKYNGVNATYRLVEGKLIITSRGGEVYAPIPHLEEEVIATMSTLNSIELNGELYIPNNHLQDITSAVKKPKNLSKQLEFYIFDIPDSTATFIDRRAQLVTAANSWSPNYVHYVYGVTCNTLQDIEDHYAKCMALGLEGTVIKDPTAMYEHNVRSSKMWKYKKALDAEFIIRAMVLDKNKQPVFTMEYTDSSGSLDTFSVKPKGTATERQLIVNTFKANYLNQWYTVEYETTSKINKPLKPVGIALRNCTPTGEPKE